MRREKRREKLTFKGIPTSPPLCPKLSSAEQEILDKMATEALFPTHLVPLLDNLYPYIGYRVEEHTYELFEEDGRLFVRSEPWMSLKGWISGKAVIPSNILSPKEVDLPKELKETVTNIFMARDQYRACASLIQTWFYNHSHWTPKQAVAACAEVQWLIPADKLTGRKTTRPPTPVEGEDLAQLKAAITFVKVLGGI